MTARGRSLGAVMAVLSKPAGGQQQAIALARQFGHFATSRRGAALAAAVVLAGGGVAYLQQLQSQQKRARER